MTQYLVGQRYWSYITSALENKPEITNANYPTWEQGASCRIPMNNGRIHTILFECPSSGYLCK